MNNSVLTALDFAQGPLFRFAFALMVLGLARRAFLIGWELLGGYLTEPKGEFRRKVGLRMAWFFFPSALLARGWPGSRLALGWHIVLSSISLALRLLVIVVPAFMVAHVHLWERGLGISWPTLPLRLSNLFTVIAIVAGLVYFFGRLYSPVLRRLEPGWTFLKPLLLILPLITGWLAAHPEASPLSYHAMLLFHVLSGVALFIALPFARMLTFIHSPLTRWMPQAAWKAAEPSPAADPAPIAGAPEVHPS